MRAVATAVRGHGVAGDAALVTLAVPGAACGVLVTLAGAMSGNLVMGVAGGAVTAASLLMLLLVASIDPLLLLAAALPLPAVYTSAGMRIGPAVVLTLLALAAWVLRAAEPRAIRLYGLPWRSILLLGGALVLSTLFTAYRGVAVNEMISWCLLLGFFLLATDQLRHTAGSARLARVLGVVCALCGFLAVLEAAGVMPGRFPLARSSFMRAALAFGSPNELGIFLALGIPFVVHEWMSARDTLRRIVAFAGVVCAVSGLVATFSRGSWLAIAVAPVFLVFAGEGRLALRCWLATAIAAVLFDVVSGGAITDRIAGTVGDWVVEQRAALMLAGVMMFLASPIVGLGPGSFDVALKSFGPGISWLWDYLPTAQNMYVQMAAETGIAGLVALIILFAVVLRHHIRGLRAARAAAAPQRSLHRAVVWSFGTACLLGFVEWVFSHGIGQQILLIAAMGYALPAARAAPGE